MVTPGSRLTGADRQALSRHRLELLALVSDQNHDEEPTSYWVDHDLGWPESGRTYWLGLLCQDAPEEHPTPPPGEEVTPPAGATLCWIDRKGRPCTPTRSYLWTWLGAEQWYYAARNPPAGMRLKPSSEED